MLGYAPGELKPHRDSWQELVHPDDLPRVMKAHTDHLSGRTTTYEVEHRLRAKSGYWKWISSTGRITERDADGRPLRITGTHRDITDRKMLEREVVEIAAQERRNIGRELHDGVCGDLTGVNFTVQGLADDLKSKSMPEAETAVRIGKQLDRAIEQLYLLSHGLNPVEIDSQGLAVALEKLTASSAELYDVKCRCRSDELVEVEDNLVAENLYRIAQEAITNAAKHSQSDHISVTLNTARGRLVLQVVDDGVGISDAGHDSPGAGLRNMRYRAGVIGADLRIERAEKGGTLVECTVSQ
jgi:PAS domain S-box-containing protein